MSWRRLFGRPEAIQAELHQPVCSTVEAVDLEPYGVLRIRGRLSTGGVEGVRLIQGGEVREPDGFFQTPVPGGGGLGGYWCEFVGGFSPSPIRLECWGIVTELGSDEVARLLEIEPHYGALLTATEVLHRDKIYSFGPPSPVVHPDVLELVADLRGAVLDFGCGVGALVRALRQRGVDARGIEMEREGIAGALGEDVVPYVDLYDGSLPLPFADGVFDCVTAIEVLEHVPDYRRVIDELVRVCAGRLVITVPDMAAIPICFPHGVVPWHLLESTHVNFFTRGSLEALLRPHFAEIQFARICNFTVNGRVVPGSLAAVCRSPVAPAGRGADV